MIGCRMTRDAGIRQKLASLAVDCVAPHREVEEWLLSVGFHYPEELHDTARRYQLCGDSFSCPEHREIFCALIEYSKRRIEPTIGLIAAVLDKQGFPTWRDGDGNPLEFDRLLRCTEVVPTGIDTYAKMVAMSAQKREEVQAHYREIRNIMSEMMC